MRLLDHQGRLLGKLNLLDGAVLFISLFFIGVVSYFARQDFLRHTQLTIESAAPQQFVPGQHQPGFEFLP
jgi:hypothetical protein